MESSTRAEVTTSSLIAHETRLKRSLRSLRAFFKYVARHRVVVGLLAVLAMPAGVYAHRHSAQGVALPKIIAVWEKVSKMRPHISISTMVHKENSSDFAMGRRPELKSEEFSL